MNVPDNPTFEDALLNLLDAVHGMAYEHPDKAVRVRLTRVLDQFLGVHAGEYTWSSEFNENWDKLQRNLDKVDPNRVRVDELRNRLETPETGEREYGYYEDVAEDATLLAERALLALEHELVTSYMAPGYKPKWQCKRCGATGSSTSSSKRTVNHADDCVLSCLPSNKDRNP